VIPQQTPTWTGFSNTQATEPAAPKLVATQYDPINRLALYLGLVYMFVQFSVLPQMVGYLLHVNLFLAYVFGVPAIAAMFLNGGVRKSFRARTAYYWLGFGCWMLVATVFSSWRGGSALATIDYWKVSLITLFIAGGILVQWSDVTKVMNVIAAAAVFNVLCGRFLRVDSGDRMGMGFGTIGNPNDYAGHLLLVLPFLLWVLLSGKIVWRLVALVGLGGGVFLILSTASRGALIAVVVDAFFFLIFGTLRQKAALVLLGPVVVAVLVVSVPSSSWRRVSEIWSTSTATAEGAEARASSAAREYLAATAIRYTMEHPIFGVGPQQFATYEGAHERYLGTHGYYHETHDCFLQAASECGIPGFLFFTGGVLSTLLLLFKTFRLARRRPDAKDIQGAVFCMLLGMVGFVVAIAFLNFAYFFYLPTMAGLATGTWSAAKDELQLRNAGV
jgi:hypothetical protein